MRDFLKTLYVRSPKSIKKVAAFCYEYYFYRKALSSAGARQPRTRTKARGEGQKIRVLFYHVDGLSFGGTEKSLQIIAKHLDKEKFDVSFMYSPRDPAKSGSSGGGDRLPYLAGSGVRMVPFAYSSADRAYPHILHDMSPTIADVLEKHDIDVILTASDGHSEFPLNIVRNVPIVLINIFGAPSLQPNIRKHLCISREVASRISGIVDEKKVATAYIQSERPPQESILAGDAIRRRFGIGEKDLVFGRIGRADDAIFDPIAIKAFKKVVGQDSGAHFVIMSPARALVNMVESEKIPNVHFLPGSAAEADIWGFHRSIDVLAHSRLDGESCGLNIIESMLCGKPIISHRSHIWNAHLEYLDDSCSRIAEKDDDERYADHMRYFIEAKRNGTIGNFGSASLKKAEPLFLIENNIRSFESLIAEIYMNTYHDQHHL